MKTELKKAIVDYIFENENEWQLQNSTTRHFRAYIYDAEGNYLIGGEEVADFIKKALTLLQDEDNSSKCVCGKA